MLKRRIARLSGFSCALLAMGLTLAACQDDLLVGQPSWLGESIYDELEQRGNFTETLKLINAQDEDYASVLQKTGSKTLFVADDDAWQEFYKNNTWGITSLDDMTEAQKKLLFKGNMINSAYLVELLGNIPSESSTSDPIEGSCMRRANSIDIMDSVPLVYAKDYPEINPARVDNTTGAQIDHWSRLRGKESALILQDDGVASMIHFMPKFMQSNNISSEDVEFMTNGDITSNSDAFINGKVITEKDITCQNGYIQVLDGVAVPLDNMANVISQDPDLSIYSRLLDRFSYPTYDATQTTEYQRQYGGEDSVFVKRYFNSHGSHSFTAYDDGTVISNQLPYDPGWNLYTLYSASGTTYQYDAAAMLVPTDDAMIDYLHGDGSDLAERYGGDDAWENAPDEVVLPLLQNTMLTSLKSAIPSQFASINNTAAEPMGVEKADIDSVLWACNGVIYKTNKVYVAPEYVSVFYPCVIRANDDLYLTYTVISNDNKVTGGEGFYAYLNNMGSKYSFIIPTDNALQNYYDPVSYNRTDTKGSSTAVAYQFYINDEGYIAASAPLVDWTNLDQYGRGEITSSLYATTPSTSTTSSGDVFNHFKDILNSSLAIGVFTPGQRFYSNKDGGPVVVQWNGSTVTGVAGSFQYERGYYIPVEETFDKSEEGNGSSYIVDEEPIMSTFTSPYAALNDSTKADEFGTFAELLDGMSIIATTDGSHATMDRCITSLNNYNYTIYVPTNATVQALIDSHQLPTWDDVDNLQNAIDNHSDAIAWSDADTAQWNKDEATLQQYITDMTYVINNFVNYHIQDNSVYIDGEEYSNSVFETACLDTATTRFVKLYVDYSLGGDMKVTDNCGNVRTVYASKENQGLANILTRQYYFDGSSLSGTSCAEIYSSSYAVIHQIDQPLFPSADWAFSPDHYTDAYRIIDYWAALQASYQSDTSVKHKGK
ncbi:MAG: hypothetical protein LUB62_03830 [Prevotellaceae bacterium]|nr:hypothetical protein [Prevotellaceae bacterium]